MPRFVVQCHTLPDGDQHWDLMLEGPRGLYTWSLPAPPDDPAALPMTVKQLADHRSAYLDYEGEISGGRGRVDIHDRGDYRWENSESEGPVGPHNQPDIADELQLELSGARLQGHFRLTRDAESGKDLWRLMRL